MAGVTAFMAIASLVGSIATAVLGYRAGHGAASLSSVLTCGAGTLLLQAFTAFVATVHGRANRAELEALYTAIERLEAAAGEPSGTDRAASAKGSPP